MLTYFSKWRLVWVEFNTPPTPGELLSLRRYKYRVALDGVETDILKLLKLQHGT